MAVITNSIGTASRDFSTIQAWEDSLPASAVTAGNSYVGECYNDSEFTSSSGPIVTFSGTTTDATHTITLTCHAGQSFRDNANIQTNALRYNQANGVGLRITASAYTSAIVLSEDYVTLRGLQVSNVNTTSDKALTHNTAGTQNATCEYCLFEAAPSTVTGIGVVTWASGTMRNCLVIQRRSGSGQGIAVSYPTSVVLANVTVVRPSDLTAATNGIEASSGTTTVTNCAVFGFSSVVNNTGRFTGSNNCSDGVAGFGTSNQDSKTYANQFQNTTDSTRDFRLKSGSDCIDTGVTDSTNAATDIAGTSRPSGSAYDIGCWEFVQAVGILYSQLEHGIGRGAFRGIGLGLGR